MTMSAIFYQGVTIYLLIPYLLPYLSSENLITEINIRDTQLNWGEQHGRGEGGGGGGSGGGRAERVCVCAATAKGIGML